jgi:hypothetical protein
MRGSGYEGVQGFGPALALHSSPQDGRHPFVGLHQPRGDGVGAADLSFPQPGRLDRVDVAGAEGRQDSAHVVEEVLVRSDDQDVLGAEVVVVDKPGHAVEADRGLTRSGSALDDEDVRG